MPKFTLLIFSFIISYILPAQDLNQNFHRDTVVNSYSELFRELARSHPGFYRYHSRASMNLYIDSIFQTMQGDSVTGWEMYRKMKTVVGRIGCLHSGLTLSPQFEKMLDSFPNVIPFQIFFRDGKAYIVRNFSSDQSISPGTEITHINGRTIDEILNMILPAIVSDGYNMTMKYLALYHDFARWYRSMVEQTTNFSVTIIRNGQPAQIQVAAVAVRDVAGDGVSSEITYPKQLEFNIENRIAKLSIHSFAKTDIKRSKQRFKKFIRSAFDEMKEKKVEHLVLDLRYNTGGTDANAAYLSKYFFDKPYRYWDRIEVTESVAKQIKGIYRFFFKKPVQKDSMWLWQKSWYTKEFNFTTIQKPAKNYFTGKTYVLINGFCMSACTELSGILSYNKRAVFIGEETGGCHQGDNSGMMPETKALGGLVMTVPLMKYVMAVDPALNFGRGVMPDHVVLPSVEDVINKKDVVMEYVMQKIKTSTIHQ
jgi:C-terminal processing protease CtpA/Prc